MHLPHTMISSHSQWKYTIQSTCWQMSCSARTVGGVDALTARSAGPHVLKLDVRLGDVDCQFPRTRKNGD